MRGLIAMNVPCLGRTSRALLVVTTLVAACVLLVARPAHADTFTVNSTGDAGDLFPGNGQCRTGNALPGQNECTLRAAIEETNANDNSATVVDEIHFAIPGTGVKTISPASSSLPFITEPVVIDGYTQGDATATTDDDATENTKVVGNNADLRIRLDGLNTTGLSFGLIIDEADNCVVRGLSITRYPAGGIEIAGASADNNTIEGNFIGLTPGGTDMGNGMGVGIRAGASDNTVGGTSPGTRNIISGNGPGGFVGNFGVAIGGTGTTGNKVLGNYIGTTKSGTGNLGNSGRGVDVYDNASSNTIGDDDPGDGLTNAANIIAFNGSDGVSVDGDASTGNSILSNSIFSNASLGIDLDSNGVTANDTGDADIGPNNLQNYPQITSAKTGRRATTIKGRLEGVTFSDVFTIQFFSNPKGTREEGKKLIGEKAEVSDGDDGELDGTISFTFKPARKVKAGLFITATATYVATDDTSEFSVPKKVRG
jgi:hypothetical protein